MKTWVVEFMNLRGRMADKEVEAETEDDAMLEALKFDPHEYDDAVMEIFSVTEKITDEEE